MLIDDFLHRFDALDSKKSIKTRRVTVNDQKTVKRLILVHFKKLPPQDEEDSESE